jgi:GT2 family glycosyltransferase
MGIRLAFIVATKDRDQELARLLASFQRQSLRPDRVVIVDASARETRLSFDAFAPLRIDYLRHSPPSAAAQRNAGLAVVRDTPQLIGFVDDDAVFEPCAVENMVSFWKSAPADVLGAAFNMLNAPTTPAEPIRRRLGRMMFGLYPADAGGVALSGWHRTVDAVATNTWVKWLPTGAVLWRRDVFERRKFDEFFSGYSYLEDLDFSFGVASEGRLVVVANAGYLHLPAPGTRGSPRQFGRNEVLNRLHFVRKHRLSVPRCTLALIGRLGMTLATAVAQRDRKMLLRAAGNLEGAWAASFSRACAHTKTAEH